MKYISIIAPIIVLILVAVVTTACNSPVSANWPNYICMPD